MQTLVGTSGYSYAPWKGSFYPEKLPAERMLTYYAERLPTVEINNTFYRMPAPEMVRKWAAETPTTFRFALKSPRRITHERRLVDVADALASLFKAAGELADKLGPVLFQLPPNFKKDAPRLDAFLAGLPAGARAALEFRHESWFTPEVYEVLRARRAALCIAEDEDLATPLEPTADWGYLRLRRQDYGDAQVHEWAQRIRAQAWSDAYVFFKHEDQGKGPQLAAQLVAALAGSG
ncbi:MAG TPA: DUF72 domain-containing protein [Polyangia bacterium]|jgi:uncharacterized protein YecE (DUF72 family)|nr:DUF72 domain-containing protein [Polyangia bacterium]